MNCDPIIGAVLLGLLIGFLVRTFDAIGRSHCDCEDEQSPPPTPIFREYRYDE